MEKKLKLYRKLPIRYNIYSAYARILISYISILVLVLGINVYIFFHVKNILVSKEISISSEYLNHTSIIIDGQLQHVKESMYGFLQDSENVVKMNSAEGDINRQLQVIQALNKFKSNIEIIEQAYIFNKALPFVIGDLGTESSSSILTKIFGNEISSEEGTDILNGINSFRIVPDQGAAIGQSTTLFLAAGINYASNVNKLLVGINVKDIARILNNTNIINYGSIYIVDSGGQVYYNSNPQVLQPDMGKELLDQIGAGSKKLVTDYEDQLVVYKRSSFFDGYYMTVTPYDHMWMKMKTIQQIFLYALGALVILGLVISIIYSRMFYQPISKILGIFKQNKERPRVKNEFAFLQNLIENVYRQNKEHEEHKVLMKSLEDADAEMEVTHLFEHQESVVAVLKGNISFNAYPFIQEYVKRNASVHEPVSIRIVGGKEWECDVIFNGPEIHMNAVKEYLVALRNAIYEELHVFLLVGIGSICSDLGQLSTSYRQALVAAQQGNSSDEQCVYEYMNVKDASISMYFPVDFGNRLTEIIAEGSKDKLHAWIEVVFERNKGLPHFYMQIIYTEFIHEFYKLANKYGISVDMTAISEKVEQEHRLLHIKNYLMELYEVLIPDAPVPQTQNTSDKVKTFVVEAVEQQYTDMNLNIVDISEKLQLSSSYVSVLFKQNMGIAFSQFLQDYRISKAIGLLEGTDCTVKEISEKVGFGTYNSFVRAFRQKIGVPPGEYRKSKREA